MAAICLSLNVLIGSTLEAKYKSETCMHVCHNIIVISAKFPKQITTEHVIHSYSC